MKKNREARFLYNFLVALTIFVVIGLFIFNNDDFQENNILTGAVVGIQILEDGELIADNSEENQSLSEIPPDETSNPIENANAKNSTEKINVEERSIGPRSASGRTVIQVFGSSGDLTISSTNIPNPWDYGVNLSTLQVYFRNTLAPNQAVQFQVQHQGNTRFINYQAQNAGNTAAIISGNKITYPDAYSGVNVTYTVYSHKLTKEIFVVNESSMRNFTFKIQFDGVTYNKTAVGSINFFDEATADRLWTIDAPYAFDSSVNESNVSQSLPKNVSVYYDIRQAGVNYFIDLIINETNLSRFTYPVVIDPTTQSGCGTLNTAGETYILNQSINTTGTCFTIGASHLTLDGAGFNITGNGSGFGIDNTAGYDNITIKNFAGINNFTKGVAATGGMVNSTIWNNTFSIANVSSSFGIDMISGVNNNISNNIIIIPGASSFGIEVQASNNNTFMFNNITTSGGTIQAIRLNNADNNTISFNNLTTHGSISSGILFLSTSTNNTIVSNSIYTDGSTSVGILFSSTGGDNTVFSNNITTIAGSSAHGIRATGGTGRQNITSNTIMTSGSGSFGISLEPSTLSYLIFSNTLTARGSSTRGISFNAANYHLVQENFINITSSSSLGVFIDGNSNHTRVISNTIITNTTGSDGIYFRTGINNTIVDGTITTLVGNNILVLNGTGTLINVSFGREISFNADATGEVTIQWYVNTNVTNGSGSALANANVSIFNISSIQVFNGLTGADGFSGNQLVTEVVQNSTTKIYSTPHSINVSLDGYFDNSTLVNVTNTNSTTMNIKLAIDLVSPTVTIVSPTNGSNFSTQPQLFNATVTDTDSSVSAVFFIFNTNTTPFNRTASNTSGNWNVSVDMSTLVEGNHVVIAYANDSANNVNNTVNVTITVDKTAPNVTLNFLNNFVNGSNFSIRSSNQTFNASIFDSLTGVQNVYFWFDNGTGQDFNVTAVNQSGNWIASYNVSTSAEERQGVRIIANDTVNNVNNTFVINFTVDKTAPTVNITTPTASSTLTGTRAFNATVSDNLLEMSIVLFQFSNGTNPFNRTASNSSGTWNVSVDTTIIAEGTLTVTVFANDTVGNMNSTQTLSVTIDNVADAPGGGNDLGGGGGGGGSSSVAKIIKKEEVPETVPEIIEEKVSEEVLPPAEEALPQPSEEKIILEKESLLALLLKYISLDKLSNMASKATTTLQNTLQEYPGVYAGIFTLILVTILVIVGLMVVSYKLKEKRRRKLKILSEKNRVEISLLKEALLRLQKLRKLYKLRKKDTSVIEQNIQRKKKRLRELRGW